MQICVEDFEDAVPEEPYTVPLGKARVLREGYDITILSLSYMNLEALKAAETLSTAYSIDCEVIDIRTVQPLDSETILKSVKKTGRVLVCDTGHKSFGCSAEILALVCENIFSDLIGPPSRLASPDHPTPTSTALADNYYPRHVEIVNSVLSDLRPGNFEKYVEKELDRRLDQPDPSFCGPF